MFPWISCPYSPLRLGSRAFIALFAVEDDDRAPQSRCHCAIQPVPSHQSLTYLEPSCSKARWCDKERRRTKGKKGLQASAVRYHMQVLTASTSSKYFKYKLFGTTYGILWLQGSYLWQYRWDAVSAFLRHFWLGKTKNRTVSTLRLRWRAESSLEFWRILENLTGYGPDIAKINQHHLKSSKICLLCLLSIFSAYSFESEADIRCLAEEFDAGPVHMYRQEESKVGHWAQSCPVP